MERGELNDLLTFAAVARERSFTRAAAILGMSPSALSHAIRGLEERLGVRLLARTTRSVSPTEAGDRLLQSLNPALEGIKDGLEALAEWRDSPSGTVRITTFAYAARMVLLPKLPSFLLAHPEVHVEINIDDGLTDIVASGFDAGIRFGESVARDMIAVKLGPDMRTVVVGTPSYFERYPPPLTPYDLQRHACIGYRLTTSGGLLPWEFEKDGKEIKIHTNGPLVANDGDIPAAVVRAGAGLGYIMECDVAEEIAAGTLVQVLKEWCPTFPGFYLYHPSRRQSPPALRALIETLSFG
ncbi:LysR family transcriptional regulator [Agrobacterium rosae]|uniref:HTH-type transcriptional regulator TtuA n=1 Tax=Agrobacterium rosae TaxID=1972867 RepID=A0A1R3U6Z1_9HYPH|nr:LysR family transcriptional regulator [Agrobacterium rosae]MBN7804380.1 LysR family transcriptional regulator [Agrobacterium rosae]MDX8302190.1 LysR family transcriptional regulator [Agrobacterium rosae]MDX8312749.1 LysR family transcriptional regulator [Agrobacterium rosae]POO55485.1 LysR family transcriptional regulator [Agrobacterium rosae]SCX33202.1 D-malate degradation protein R [Agrobacterium rosae]